MWTVDLVQVAQVPLLLSHGLHTAEPLYHISGFNSFLVATFG